MPETKQAMVGLEALTNMIDEIKSIDEQTVVIKGTAAEWVKQGTEAAMATPILSFFDSDKARRASMVEAIGPVANAKTIGEYLDAVTSLKLESEMFASIVRDEWIKSHRTDSDNLDALRTRRDELVSQAEAFRTVFASPMFLAQFGLESADDLPIVPTASKSRASSTTAGGKKSSKKSMHFYYYRDGARLEMPGSQDRLSSVAWYRFKVSVDILEAALLAQHGRIDQTVQWDGVVKIDSDIATDKKVHEVRIGWEVIAGTDTDDTEADEPEVAPAD